MPDNKVLAGDYLIPSGGYGGFSDNLAASQDWSSFEGIRFWWYASQPSNPASPTAGDDIKVELKDGGPDGEHSELWATTFKDNWGSSTSRWKLVELPFSSFALGGYQPGSAETQNGTLDLTSAWGFAPTFTPGKPDQHAVGHRRRAALRHPRRRRDGRHLGHAGRLPRRRRRHGRGRHHGHDDLGRAPGCAGDRAVLQRRRLGRGRHGLRARSPENSPSPQEPSPEPSRASPFRPWPPATPTRPAASRSPSNRTTPACRMPPLVSSSTPTDCPTSTQSLPVDERVADLLGRMSQAEKVGQMAQAERLGPELARSRSPTSVSARCSRAVAPLPRRTPRRRGQT